MKLIHQNNQNIQLKWGWNCRATGDKCDLADVLIYTCILESMCVSAGQKTTPKPTQLHPSNTTQMVCVEKALHEFDTAFVSFLGISSKMQ